MEARAKRRRRSSPLLSALAWRFDSALPSFHHTRRGPERKGLGGGAAAAVFRRWRARTA